MNKNTLKIEDRTAGDGHPCFVVAEIGSNHCRDIRLAKDLVAMAKGAGAVAVKLQSLKGSRLAGPDSSRKAIDLYDKI